MRAILALAIREDLGTLGDWTTRALVAEDAVGPGGHRGPAAGRGGGAAGRRDDPGRRRSAAAVVAAGRGRPAGGRGASASGMIEGPARGLLAAERMLLNLLGRLSGIATLTRRYVDAVAGTEGPHLRHPQDHPRLAAAGEIRRPLRRRLEPSQRAVRGGADQGQPSGLGQLGSRPTAAGARLSRPPRPLLGRGSSSRKHAGRCARWSIEVEVDTLEQFDEVLAARPDIVLLDNMSPAELREAVARRDAVGAGDRVGGLRRRRLGHGPRDRRERRGADQRRGADAFGRRVGLRSGLDLIKPHGCHAHACVDMKVATDTCPRQAWAWQPTVAKMRRAAVAKVRRR